MLTVNLLEGGGGGCKRDWEIKFILNSFPLMWQLPPPFPPRRFGSSPQAAQRGVCSKAHLIGLCFVHRMHFFHPQLNLKLHSIKVLRTFDSERIRYTAKACAKKKYEFLGFKRDKKNIRDSQSVISFSECLLA